MKSMPISQLPWEAQLLFWVLLVLVGVGMSLISWFLVRYVLGQDKINDNNSVKFDSISRKFEDMKKDFSSSAERSIREIQEVQKSALGVRRETLEDFNTIKTDIQEIKAVTKDVATLTKAVEAHHSVLKTIIVRLNNMMIIKGEKKD